jgi:hypothetical protein
MYQILADSGVDLSKDVAVIVESEVMDGSFVPVKAFRGKVISSLPDYARNHFPDFDPEYDIALFWQTGDEDKIAVFTLFDDMEVLILQGGGLVFESDMLRMLFGQTPHFLRVQAELAKMLKSV